MIAFASASSPAADIAAASGLISAILLAWVALRAQSAAHQLEAISKLIDDALQDHLEKVSSLLHENLDAPTRGIIIGDWVKKAMREVLGEHPKKRRWYDPDD